MFCFMVYILHVNGHSSLQKKLPIQEYARYTGSSLEKPNWPNKQKTPVLVFFLIHGFGA